MNVGYVEQQVKDISFSISRGENIEGLTILCEKCLTLPFGKIRAAIIGESHFVIFNIFGVAFTELVACVERDIPAILSGKLVDKIKPISHKFPQADYHLQITVYNNCADGRNALHGVRILAENPKSNGIGLIKEFPKLRDARVPCTLLTVTAEHDIIRIMSIHTYPTDGQGKIVHTVSSLQKT